MSSAYAPAKAASTALESSNDTESFENRVDDPLASDRAAAYCDARSRVEDAVFRNVDCDGSEAPFVEWDVEI